MNKHQLVVGRNKIIWLITRIYGILYYQFYAIQISSICYDIYFSDFRNPHSSEIVNYYSFTRGIVDTNC